MILKALLPHVGNKVRDILLHFYQIYILLLVAPLHVRHEV